VKKKIAGKKARKMWDNLWHTKKKIPEISTISGIMTLHANFNRKIGAGCNHQKNGLHFR